MERDEMVAMVTDRVRRCAAAELTTVAPDGFPHTRSMENHNPHEGFVFWFATHRRTRKVMHIRQNPRVSVHYPLKDEGGYICILGLAELCTDEASRRYLWRSEWEKHWPEGPMAESYIPIRIRPTQIEYYNLRDGAIQPDGYGGLIVSLDAQNL